MLVFGGVHVFGVSRDLDWFYHDWSKRETRGPISPVARFLSLGVGVHFISDDWTRTQRFFEVVFFGTTSTSEEIYVFFPAILGIFNVFFGNHEAFPQQMFIGLSLDLSPKNSWRLLLKGTLRTSLDCSYWEDETVHMYGNFEWFSVDISMLTPKWIVFPYQELQNFQYILWMCLSHHDTQKNKWLLWFSGSKGVRVQKIDLNPSDPHLPEWMPTW